MTSSPREFLDHVTALSRDAQFQREAAQIQAKSLLYGIAREIPDYNWSYSVPRVLRNLSLASFEVETLAQRTPDRLASIEPDIRRVAMLWEALAGLGSEGPERNVALLGAAVNYELAGYQANAACLAGRVSVEDPVLERGTPLGLVTLFLQRRFLRARIAAEHLLVAPETSKTVTTGVILAIGHATFASGIASAIAFFMSGDGARLVQAHGWLKEAETLYAAFALVSEANLSRGLRSLLPIMGERSTWRTLAGKLPESPIWLRYLKLLARGPGNDVYRARSVSELWPSQLTAVRHGLLSDNATKIIRMPTSAGKTRIAELAIVHTLVANPGARCLYIAPYRALVAEVEASLAGLLSDLGMSVSSFAGSFETDDFEEEQFRSADVLILTPEKLDLIARVSAEAIDSVRLIIVDEAHIVSDWQRGVKVELLLGRIRKLVPLARCIVTSAVVPQQTLEDFAAWFKASPDRDIVKSTWRPSVQRVARFQWKGETGIITYAPSGESSLLSEFVPGIVRARKYEYRNPDSGRMNRRVFPDITNKAQTCAELAAKLMELGPVLIFCPTGPLVKAVATAFAERLDLLARAGEPTESGSSRIANRSSAVAREWLGEGDVVTLLDAGVGIHYRGLPDALKKAVETDFREGRLRILAATNTLAQGVNLPFRSVIIHSCRRYTPDEGHVRITARDYWNIAGRAGRAGAETEGSVVHIVSNQADLADYQYFLSKREDVEPVVSALFGRLQGLIQGRISEEGLKADIDVEILALLVEEDESHSSESLIDSMLDNTLASVQATRSGTSLQRLRAVMHSSARAIGERVPGKERRSLYAGTGLSSTTCQVFAKHIEENAGLLRELLVQGGAPRRMELLDLVLPTLLAVSEMETKQTFAGNNHDLLDRWISGADIRAMVSEFAEGEASTTEFIKYLEDFCGYLLPWGLAGYLRIGTAELEVAKLERSELARYLPTMIRTGLPDATSCWVAAAGIPFRQTAMRIAREYEGTTNRPSLVDFHSWLGSLSPDRLHYDFGLDGPLLDDVSRAVMSFGRNALVKDFANLAESLPMTAYVLGIRYEGRERVAARIREGEVLGLVRDYDNAIDRNAIVCEHTLGIVGSLERRVAQLLAPELDTGTRLHARVKEPWSQAKGTMTIEIEGEV